jgi:hypothetical protein
MKRKTINVPGVASAAPVQAVYELTMNPVDALGHRIGGYWDGKNFEVVVVATSSDEAIEKAREYYGTQWEKELEEQKCERLDISKLVRIRTVHV